MILFGLSTSIFVARVLGPDKNGIIVSQAIKIGYNDEGKSQ